MRAFSASATFHSSTRWDWSNTTPTWDRTSLSTGRPSSSTVSRTRVQTFPDEKAIAGYLRTDRRAGDVALFKAGRQARFERIIEYVYHDKDLTPLAGEPEWRRKKPKPGKLQDVRDSRKEGGA